METMMKLQESFIEGTDDSIQGKTIVGLSEQLQSLAETHVQLQERLQTIQSLYESQKDLADKYYLLAVKSKAKVSLLIFDWKLFDCSDF